MTARLPRRANSMICGFPSDHRVISGGRRGVDWSVDRNPLETPQEVLADEPAHARPGDADERSHEPEHRVELHHGGDDPTGRVVAEIPCGNPDEHEGSGDPTGQEAEDGAEHTEPREGVNPLVTAHVVNVPVFDVLRQVVDLLLQTVDLVAQLLHLLAQARVHLADDGDESLATVCGAVVGAVDLARRFRAIAGADVHDVLAEVEEVPHRHLSLATARFHSTLGHHCLPTKGYIVSFC